jgi:hypothetical protein
MQSKQKKKQEFERKKWKNRNGQYSSVAMRNRRHVSKSTTDEESKRKKKLNRWRHEFFGQYVNAVFDHLISMIFILIFG